MFKIRGFNLLKRFFSFNQVKMSSLSPTMTSGKIVKWNVKKGDKIEIGDVIAEIETDKSTIGFEMTEEGYVNKLLKSEGTEDIKIGETIAILCENEEDIDKNFEINENNNNTEKNNKEQIENNNEESNDNEITYPDHNLITMPTLSPTMEKGKITELLVKEGDEISVGDSYAKIETDKSVMDFESQDEGFIAKVFVKVDEDLEIGKNFLIMVDEKESIEKFKDYNPNKNIKKKEVKKEIKLEEKTIEKKEILETVTNNNKDRYFISPLAKNIAKEKNIDISKIKGTGPNNRIISKNVLEYKEEIPKTKKQDLNIKEKIEESLYEEIPLSNMRKIIAERLQFSKQNIPHYYLEKSINFSNLIKFRKEINEKLESKITLNDFIIKAVAKSNEDVPEVNSQWNDNTIKKFNNVDVAIAVDIGNGLITPIVPNANKLKISEISDKTKELIKKAKDNKLLPNEFQGGTITISNLGMMGIDNFSAIINPPQSCILAVGKVKKTIRYKEDLENNIEWIDEINMTISCDHRVIDGAVGAKWFERLQYYLENPLNMLL